MSDSVRVALFADTFHEVNGAARTCREWDDFARRRQLPFFCIRRGPRQAFVCDGPVWSLELIRSRWALPVDPDLLFDPWFWRAREAVEEHVRRFRPDFIHITSPGDLGLLGAMLAERLKIPLACSWHTNLHEFAARRAGRLIWWMPRRTRDVLAGAVERFVLDRVCWFFRRSRVIFAPNDDLIDLLRRRTGRPVFHMGRGVDTVLFHPGRRRRTDSDLVLGYVGRLMPEKNLRILPGVAEALREAGCVRFRFQITGAGSERPWLERNLPHAEFTGVLTGEPLARAYAGMDIFVFPSLTDTFGNVVQEALASGVPAVVVSSGGPRFIVRDGVSGLVASSEDEFCRSVVALALSERQRRQMGREGRRQVERESWDRVFEEVYSGFRSAAPADCRDRLTAGA